MKDAVPFRLSFIQDTRFTVLDSDEQTLQLGSEHTQALKKLASKHSAGLLTLLKCALALLISRYTAQADITFGALHANRTEPELSRSLGLYADTALLRTTVDETLNVAQYLSQNGPLTQADLDGCSTSGLQDDALCSVMLILHPRGSKTATLSPLELSPIALPPEPARFDITVNAVETVENRLKITFNYRKRLFAPAFIARLLEGMQLILTRFLHEKMMLSSIEITTAEQRRTLAAFSTTSTLPTGELSLVQRWQKQVKHAPNAVALRFNGETLTYTELDRRAEVLAHQLSQLRKKRVALMLDRGVMAIVAMLAILKAGAVYVPVDPAWPSARLCAVLLDSAVAMLITSSDYSGRQVCCPEQILDDSLFAAPPVQHAKNLTDPHQPAAIMYTYGTDGEPMGVAIPQSGIRRLVCYNDPVPVLPGDCVAQTANLTCDASAWEIWGALLNGATLVILPDKSLANGFTLARALLTQHVTHAWLPVALFTVLAAEDPDAFGGLRHLLLSGGTLNPASVAMVMRSNNPPENIWNGYSLTENTTFTALHYISDRDIPVNSSEPASIPVGRPIINTCCYVLDKKLRPVPIGAVGELYVSGEGLVNGYITRPDQTAKAFLPNPFYEQERQQQHGGASKTMYKTGDLACWLEDGTLMLTGRARESAGLQTPPR